MTVMEAIKSRRSVRRYDPRPVEEEKLLSVLEAGRLAPSARNRQNWRFVAATDPALRETLSEACNGQQSVAEAPVTLCVVATGQNLMPCGQTGEVIDAAIALSFMMLEAQEQGLCTCWLGAFQAEAVREALGLPEEEVVVAVTPLGYPAEFPEPRPRKPLDEVVVRK